VGEIKRQSASARPNGKQFFWVTPDLNQSIPVKRQGSVINVCCALEPGDGHAWFGVGPEMNKKIVAMDVAA
jgi:hypothetical protein